MDEHSEMRDRLRLVLEEALGREPSDEELEDVIVSLRDRWRPYVEEVRPGDDEIERMLREEAGHLRDPETKIISGDDLEAIVSTRVRLVTERRLRETYPHLFGS